MSRIPWKPRTKNIVGVSLVALLLFLGALGSWFVWNRDDDGSSERGVDQSQERESSSPSPSKNVPPELPSEAYLADEVGIEATARYDIEAQNYATRTNDPAPLEAIYDVQACEVCFNVIETTKERKEQGLTVSGGQITVTSISNTFNFGYLEGTANQAGVVDVEYVRAESRMTDSSNSELESAESQTIISRYSVIYRDGHWVVTHKEKRN